MKVSSGRSAPTAGSSTLASAVARSGTSPSNHAAAATLATRENAPKAASAPCDLFRPASVGSSAIPTTPLRRRPRGATDVPPTRRAPAAGRAAGRSRLCPAAGPRGGIRDLRGRGTLAPRQRLRHRHRALAVHRPQDRSDLLLPHAPEDPRRRRVIQPVDDGRRLLGPHALVDLGDCHAAARGLARRRPAPGLNPACRLGQRLLERLHRRLARREGLLAAVELLAALAHGLEQLAET